jgi:hypothetical protein
MRLTTLLLALTLPMAAQTTQPISVATLAALHDRYRPLLVFAPDITPEFREQMWLLSARAKDLHERDVITVPITDHWSEMGDGIFDSIQTLSLSKTEQAAARRRFHIAPSSFTVILLGKDGGEKLRSHKPLTLKKLNDTIDAMPMRQEEMRARRSPPPS